MTNEITYQELADWINSLPDDYEFEYLPNKLWHECCPVASYIRATRGVDDVSAAHSGVRWLDKNQVRLGYFQTPKWMSLFMSLVDTQMREHKVTLAAAKEALQRAQRWVS